MRVIFLPVLALIFAAGSAHADIRLITRKLPSGLVVVLAPETRSQEIAVHLTFDAGSRHDDRKSQGTASIASRIAGRRLASFQADLNQERAIFTARVAPENLSDLLAEAQRALLPPPLTREELLQAGDNRVGQTAQQQLLQLVDGTGPDAPAAVQQKDVERFLEKHYRPLSAVIALAGTFDEQVVMARLADTLGRIPAGSPRERCKPKPRKLSREARREVHDSAAKQEEIHIGYPTAPSSHPDWFALNILADIIGQGAGSRLQAALVGRGLATDFGEGEAESPCGASLLRMRVRLAPNVRTDAVMAVIDAELQRLAVEGVTSAEVATAREQERQWSEDQLSTAAGVASAAARAVLFYGDAQRVNTELERMLTVSAGDVRRVAQRYLQPSNRAVVVVKR